METVQQILTRVDKLSKSRPVSEEEYLAAIKKALTSVEKKLAKTKGRWTRRRMDAIIVQLRRELKSPTRKFIESFFDDMLSAIWADYKKGISQYDEDMTLYELDKESVINTIGFRSIAFERMNAAGKRIPYSVDVDEFLKSVDVDTAKKVKSAIVSGAVTGVNPNEAAAQAARIIAEVRGIKSKEAANLRTVVRTMYADAQNRVHMQFLEDNQHIYDYFEYVAKLDNRTTEMCRYMDEKEWAFYDDIPPELMPPLHPNCRSIIVGMVEDQETQPTTTTTTTTPKSSNDTLLLYHGTPAVFEEFDRAGARITSIGYGSYFTPDKQLALQYGENIHTLELPKNKIIDLDNLTDKQRTDIIAELDDAVPEDIKAGFGELIKIDTTDMDREAAIDLFNEKREETQDYFHDRAKAQLIREGDTVYIQYMDQGLSGASDANIKDLIQKYDQSIMSNLGYISAKSNNEVVIYDLDYVNELIREYKKKQ